MKIFVHRHHLFKIVGLLLCVLVISSNVLIEINKDTAFSFTVTLDCCHIYSPFRPKDFVVKNDSSSVLEATPRETVPKFKEEIDQSHGRKLDGGDDDDFELFGSFNSLNAQDSTLTLLIVVLIILVLEHILHEVHVATYETPFADMVAAIEKELMIVGGMSFCVGMLTAANIEVSSSILHSFSIAETLSTLSAFLFCMQGLILVLLSIRDSEIWAESFHEHEYEILIAYYAITEDAEHDTRMLEDTTLWTYTLAKEWKRIVQKLRWLPVSPINSAIEFRIMHNAFCEYFSIQKHAFAFDDYVRRCYEKYLLNVITIDPANWILVILLSFVNWYRVSSGYWGVTSWCDYTGSNVEHCKLEHEMKGYMILGFSITLLNVVMAIVSRCFEFRVLQHQGVYGLDDYAPYLHGCAKQTKAVVKTEQQRLGADELRKAIRAGEHLAQTELEKSSNMLHRMWTILSSCFKRKSVQDAHENALTQKKAKARRHSLIASSFQSNNSSTPNGSTRSLLVDLDPMTRSNVSAKKQRERRSGSDAEELHDVVRFNLGLNKHIKQELGGIERERSDSQYDEGNRGRLYSNESNSISSSLRERVGSGDSFMPNEPPIPEGAMLSSSFGSSNARSSTASPTKQLEAQKRDLRNRKSLSEIAKDQKDYRQSKAFIALTAEDATGKFKVNMPNIFYFEGGAAYFEIVDHLMMLMSFYGAIWVLNYVFIARDLPDALFWQFMTILPAFCSLAAYLVCVRSAALLKAVTHLDTQNLRLTIEETEHSQALGTLVRDKIIAKLADMDDNPKAALRSLFNLIDTNNSLLLSRLEFKVFLEEMHISFSNKRWKQIFREIDRNFDDEISFDELFIFIFPDNDEAASREAKRLKLIRERVKWVDDDFQSGGAPVYKTTRRKAIDASVFALGDAHDIEIDPDFGLQGLVGASGNENAVGVVGSKPSAKPTPMKKSVVVPVTEPQQTQMVPLTASNLQKLSDAAPAALSENKCKVAPSISSEASSGSGSELNSNVGEKVAPVAVAPSASTSPDFNSNRDKLLSPPVATAEDTVNMPYHCDPTEAVADEAQTLDTGGQRTRNKTMSESLPAGENMSSIDRHRKGKAKLQRRPVTASCAASSGTGGVGGSRMMKLPQDMPHSPPMMKAQSSPSKRRRDVADITAVVESPGLGLEQPSVISEAESSMYVDSALAQPYMYPHPYPQHPNSYTQHYMQPAPYIYVSQPSQAQGSPQFVRPQSSYNQHTVQYPGHQPGPYPGFQPVPYVTPHPYMSSNPYQPPPGMSPQYYYQGPGMQPPQQRRPRTGTPHRVHPRSGNLSSSSHSIRRGVPAEVSTSHHIPGPRISDISSKPMLRFQEATAEFSMTDGGLQGGNSVYSYESHPYSHSYGYGGPYQDDMGENSISQSTHTNRPSTSPNVRYK